MCIFLACHRRRLFFNLFLGTFPAPWRAINEYLCITRMDLSFGEISLESAAIQPRYHKSSDLTTPRARQVIVFPFLNQNIRHTAHSPSPCPVVAVDHTLRPGGNVPSPHTLDRQAATSMWVATQCPKRAKIASPSLSESA